MLLGCIADDFTGATDLANNLVRAGMRCVLTNGIPRSAPTADADVVCGRVEIANDRALTWRLSSRWPP